MVIFLFVASILVFLYPFLDLFFLSKAIMLLENISPSLNQAYKDLGSKPINSKLNIANIFPKHAKEIINDQKVFIQYKKSFLIFLEYFVSGFILIILNIIIFTCSFFYLSNEQKIYMAIIIFMNLLILWILKISAIVHQLGFHKFATFIDNFSFEFLSCKGKFNNWIYSTGLHLVTYLLSIVFFYLYYRLINTFLIQVVAIDLLVIFLELAFYNYIVNRIIAYGLNFIIKKLIIFIHHDFNFYYQMLKNTSYIVFLSIYFLFKYIQIASGDFSFNSTFIESVGILFLLDTYLDKISSERHLNSVNKVQNTEVNNMCTTNISSKETTTALPQGNPEFNISDTAMTEYFTVVSNEYQIERNKKQSIETRSGLLLTLLAAISVFNFQTIKFSDIVLLCKKPLTFILFLKIVSGILIYLSLIFCFFSIIKTLSVKRHDNFEVNGINEFLLCEDRKNALARLIFTYRDIIVQHRSSNENRAKWYKSSLYSTLLLIISTITYISL